MSRKEANAKYHHKRQHRDGNLSSGFHLRIEMKEKEEKVSSIIGFWWLCAEKKGENSRASSRFKTMPERSALQEMFFRFSLSVGFPFW